MVFNSLQFLWFFLVVYALYRLLPAVAPAGRAHRAQNWLLLVASYYFYGSWDWRFLGLLIASTVIDYFCALYIDRRQEPRRRRMVMWLSIGFNLSVLGFFKYFNFFADNLHALFAAMGWQLDFVTLRVLLPIGISFYTFVTMSYVIDVYRREILPTRNLLDFAVFVAYFPHLVAGPILRATALLPQISQPRRITHAQVRDGLWLIAWGFFQKIFVADNLAPLSALAFAPDAHLTGVNVLLGTYAFAFQIYGDFAGYSNIARGTSKLMGIELMENFRFPYFVVTPQAFWRNWHISLSTWLRDYLHFLGGNRGTAWQTRRNLLLTMILGGLWHGAAWTFVLWPHQGLLLHHLPAAGRTFDDLRGSEPFRRGPCDVSSDLLRLADLPRAVTAQARRADAKSPFPVRSGDDRRHGPARAVAPLHHPVDRRAPRRGAGRRRAGGAATAHSRALLDLRRDVVSDPPVRQLRRVRLHLLSVLMRAFLAFLVVAWLPGALLFRLPIAERDKRARFRPMSARTGQACSAWRRRWRSCLAWRRSIVIASSGCWSPNSRSAWRSRPLPGSTCGSDRRPAAPVRPSAFPSRSSCWARGGFSVIEYIIGGRTPASMSTKGFRSRSAERSSSAIRWSRRFRSSRAISFSGRREPRNTSRGGSWASTSWIRPADRSSASSPRVSASIGDRLCARRPDGRGARSASGDPRRAVGVFPGRATARTPRRGGGRPLLALNVVQVWFARYPNADIVMQALLFAALLAIARACRRRPVLCAGRGRCSGCCCSCASTP
jgi:D-alanyl-lipoteichoic acid acyltransferase DltB (MBOAT superfamily)